ncbi:protein phosphatase 2C domain-containing protein [Sphaerisporangium sp. NPDC005289]|uniref:protein phosphatase 2C domain-containing protein n=1 Tax=Sphaerisporangium sp. NPDC005289 TaxID=3155247 RepID=UPI0033A45FDE
MHVTFSTAAAPVPGRRNEDLVIAGPEWVAVLDGATAAAGVDSGCRHDVAWYVARLGAGLARGLAAEPDAGLRQILAAAIGEATDAHGGACDLANADSPSSTVAMVRRRADMLDYLVLCDSPVVLHGRDGMVTVIDDDRIDHLPGGRPYSVALVRSVRNRPGGFWVAGALPEAAGEAVAGSVEAAGLSGVLLATDGVTRLVEWYGHTWEHLVETAAKAGTAELIAQVREAELRHGTPAGAKPHDDATAAWASW